MTAIKSLFLALFLVAFLAVGAPVSAQDTGVTTTTVGTTTPLLPETGAGGDAARNLTLLAAALALVGGAVVAFRNKAA